MVTTPMEGVSFPGWWQYLSCKKKDTVGYRAQQTHFSTPLLQPFPTQCVSASRAQAVLGCDFLGQVDSEFGSLFLKKFPKLPFF